MAYYNFYLQAFDYWLQPVLLEAILQTLLRLNIQQGLL